MEWHKVIDSQLRQINDYLVNHHAYELTIVTPTTHRIMAAVSSVVVAAEPREKSPQRSVKDVQLRVSENGRYFVDQHGKPFFYLGDTCWLLFQRLDREEVDEYLKDRAGKVSPSSRRMSCAD